ncbi:MAG TPA: hypothetical protein VJ184_07015, partial [Chryseolinea sp.]|nr:hypothetical protein [Chryseolinea sp.]
MQWFHFVLALCVLVLFQQGTINVQWQQTNWQGFVNCSIVSLASAGPGGTNLFALTNEEADIQ